MEQTTYASRLRYLDADDVDDSVVDYDGLDVVGPDGERIGDVDGFIVDARAGRVNYVVVDSGGWFRSRRFLIPIGHAAIGTDQASLQVDVTRAALFRYPEFDENRFREFSDDDMQLFERNMSAACCPDAAEPLAPCGAQPHYTQPAWWSPSSYPHERLRPVDTGVYHEHRRRFATAAGATPPEPRETVHDDGRARRTAERTLVEDDEPRQSER